MAKTYARKQGEPYKSDVEADTSSAGMLVITIEVWPGGDKAKAYPIGTGVIGLVSGTPTRGNYATYFSAKDGKSMWKRGEVYDFPRKKLLVWDLLYRALHNVAKDRT